MKIEITLSGLKETLIGLGSYFKNNVKVILKFVLAGIAVSSLFIMIFQDGKFKSTSTLLVDEIYTESSVDKNINLAWLETYRDLLYSDTVVDATISKSDSDISKEELKDNIYFLSNNNSLLFSVQMISNSKNELNQLSKELIPQYIKMLEELENVDTVMVVGKTKVEPISLVKENSIIIFMGIVFGFLTSVGYIQLISQGRDDAQ